MQSFVATRRVAVATVSGLALVIASLPAAAEPCSAIEGGLGQGPVSVGFLEGDLGAARRVCPRSEAGFGGQAGVVFEPEKYGTSPAVHVGSGSPIQASAEGRVFGSLKLTRRLEVFGSFQPVSARLIISSFQGSYIGLGNTSAGATLVVYEAGPFAMGVTAQLTLPTAIGLYRNAWPIGLDTGLVFAFEPFPFFQLHGQFSGVGSVALSTAAFDPRAGMLAVAGGELLLFDWVGLVVDINSLGFYNAPIDYVAVAAGIRSKIYAGLAAELVGIAPLLGEERTLARVRASLSYRF